VCCTSLDARSGPEPNRNNGQPVTVDRQSNIVLFGVPENRDASIWRHSIDNILNFVFGYSVGTIDMFRLGRFSSLSCRPVLVKLRTVWDKRLIMSKRSKLKNYDQRGVFIDSDEPVAVRRKQTFDRLKRKAEREGKRVSVSDGTLCIDDIAVFSVRDGFLNNYTLNG
jgi:hypothetical protein